MNPPRATMQSDGDGGSHIHIERLRPGQVKFGIAGTVIVTVALVIINLIYTIGLRSSKYDAACKQVDDHEVRLRAVEKAVADIPRIMDNTTAIKEMLRSHTEGNR